MDAPFGRQPEECLMLHRAFTDQLTWPCATCRQDIADGTGFVHVSNVEASRQEAAIRSWELTHRDGALLSEVFEMPDVASWKANHTACIPEEDQGYTWE